MLDIKEGDLLVVSGTEYPIRYIEKWTRFPASPAFKRTATVTASTKRASVSSEQRDNAVTNLSSVKCTPLDPVSTEIANRLPLQMPIKLLSCYVADSSDTMRLYVEEEQR